MSDSKLSVPQASPEGVSIPAAQSHWLVIFFAHIYYQSEQSTLLSASCFKGKHLNYFWAPWKDRASWKCLNHRFICQLHAKSSSLSELFVSYGVGVGLNLLASFCSTEQVLIWHQPHWAWAQWGMPANFLTNS